MKKKMLTLLAFLVAISSIFAVYVEIGDGTTTTNYFPTYGLYDYSWSNYILTSEQIGDAIDINEIQFYVDNTPSSYNLVNQQVYMKLTTDTEVLASYPDPANNGFTLVYDGAVNWDGSGWQGIILDSEFSYDGSSNLHIAWINNNAAWSSGYPTMRKTDVENNVGAYDHADNTFPVEDGTLVTFYPNTRLGYAVEGAPGFPTAVYPENNSMNVEIEVTLEWTYGENTEIIDVYLSDVYEEVTTEDPTALVVDGVLSTSYSASLENATVYYWKVVASNTTSEIEVPTQVMTFTTIYGVAELPYSEDFEGVTPPALPLGWNKIHESTTTYSYVETYNSSYSAYEGVNMFRLANSSDNSGTYIAIMPEMENLNSRLKFFAKCSSTGSQLIVGHISDITDAETFTPIETIDMTSDYLEHTVALELDRTVRYVAFKHANVGTYQTIYIDNILVEEIPENEPTPATLLTPVDGAIGVALDAELTWEYGINTASVNLYLSDDMALVDELDPSTLVVENQDVTSYTADLAEWTTYYWRIGSLNTTGYEVLTDIFTFTTVTPEGTIQVGTGVETNQGMPMEPYFGYTYSQSIYHQSLVNQTGTIESVAWQYNGYSAWGPDDIKVYMAHTTIDSFDTTESWLPISDFTLVYDGTLSVPAVEGWVPITLDTPFEYNNTDNLVIAFEENTQGYHGSNEEFYNTVADSDVSIIYRSDSTDPDPTNPPIGTLKSYYPNVMLSMSTVEPPEYLPPTDLLADIENDNDVVLSWTAPASEEVTAYEIYRDDVMVNTTDDASVSSWTDTGLADGTYEYYVTALYGEISSVPSNTVEVEIDTFVPTYNPPTNLQASVVDVNDVELTWEAPEVTTRTASNTSLVSLAKATKDTRETRELTGYKVYRDEVEIADLSGTVLTYLDEDLADGSYDYYVTAVYTEQESDPSNTVTALIETAEVPYPPSNLTAEVLGSEVELSWEAPIDLSQGVWLTKSAEENNDGIGVNGPAEFGVAHMYTEAELAMYQGLNIQSIKFFPREASATYQVAVWGGADGQTLLHSEDVATFTNEAWNEHQLTLPVAIPTEGPVYIGYLVNTPAGFPAGCDAGPAVAGGDMIHFVGDPWSPLAQIAAIDVNWNIQAFVSSEGGDRLASKMIVTANKPAQVNQNHAQFVAGNLNPIATSIRNNVTRDVTGYKVYRDETEIAEVTADVFTYTDSGLEDGTYEYYVTALYGDTESEASNTVTVDIININPDDVILADSFESYTDFALQFGEWTLVDGDLSGTYGFSGIAFPNAEGMMAYTVFNPMQTTPPLDDPGYEAADGSKYLASFAAVTPPNNDWLISQPFWVGPNGGDVMFTAKSITNQYGLERFNVLVSDGSTNPNDFTNISGTSYVEAPMDWTNYSYSLDDYSDQIIRVAVQCVSNDAFVFMLDDFKVLSPDGIVDNNDNNTPQVTASLSNYPNPFNPETTINYSVVKAGKVTLEVYNVLGQKVKTLVNDTRDAGSHSVVWNGQDDAGKNVSSGVYFYRLKNGSQTNTNKMILMK